VSASAILAWMEAVPPLDDLEPTAFPSAAAPPSAILPELEPTRVADAEPPSFDDVMAALTAALPPERWIESTCQEDVEVDVEPLEVERTSPPEPAEPRSEATPCACRYCETAASPGQAFCDRCGMHLERWLPSAPDAIAGEPVRCRRCGAVASGERCPCCGDRRPEG
jgi:hypothetical protein